MPYVSIHGRKVGFNEGGLLFDGRPVGAFVARGPKGKVFFVDSAVDGTDGTSPESAVGTIDEAFALCTANQGDTIYVMPNHAETITTAAGIAHDVAGVSVIGLGTYNNRPRVLLDTATTVTYAISAADAFVSNIVFASGHADIATCFNVTAVGAHIDSCEFVNNVVDENFVTEIKATGAANTADGMKVTNCRALTVDASAAEFIELTDDIDSMVVSGNVVIKDAGTAAKLILCATGKDLTNVVVDRNYLVSGATSGDMLIDNDTAVNTGIVCNNLVGHHDTAGVIIVDADGVRQFQNYSVGSDTESGVLMPAADTLT